MSLGPLSTRFDETVAALRERLADFPADALAGVAPADVALLAGVVENGARTLLNKSTLNAPHPILPLLLDLAASLHMALRHLAYFEGDTQRKGRLQNHALAWQRWRVALSSATQWTAWGLSRTNVTPMLTPRASGLPENPFEAYHTVQRPSILQNDAAQWAQRALIHSDPARLPLEPQAVAGLARDLRLGTNLKGVI